MHIEETKMTKSYISCYNNETKELEHFEVPEPVYVYIVQLENEIKYASGGVKRTKQIKTHSSITFSKKLVVVMTQHF
jgi:hypothetical protein